MNDLEKILNSLNSNEIKQVNASIKKITKLKNDMVKALLNSLVVTKKTNIRKELALAIVDNFKDERVIPILKELITDKRLEQENAILVYALGEYTNSIELLDFLVEIVIEKDYHAAINAINIIFSMIPEISIRKMKALLIKVESREQIDDEKKEIIEDLKLFFKNQII